MVTLPISTRQQNKILLDLIPDIFQEKKYICCSKCKMYYRYHQYISFMKYSFRDNPIFPSTRFPFVCAFCQYDLEAYFDGHPVFPIHRSPHNITNEICVSSSIDLLYTCLISDIYIMTIDGVLYQTKNFNHWDYLFYHSPYEPRIGVIIHNESDTPIHSFHV